MFFGHPGSRFSVRGLSKARDFYVFRASRIPIQYSRFEQSSWFLCFSGIQDPDLGDVNSLFTALFKNHWFGQIPGVALKIMPNRRNFHENTCKTLISPSPQIEGLSGLVVFEKPLFCCNGVPFRKKKGGFASTECKFLVQNLQKSSFCWSKMEYSSLRGQMQEKRPKMPSSR